MIFRHKINFLKIFFIVITICFSVTIYSKNSTVVVDQVCFPTPPQMRLLQNPLPAYLATLIPSTNSQFRKRLATYFPNRDVEVLSLGKKTIPERFCFLEVIENHVRQKWTLSEFRSLNNAVIEKFSQFKTMGDIFRESGESGSHFSSQITDINSVPIKYIGVSAEGNNYMIYSWGTLNPDTAPGSTARARFVVTTGALLLNGHYFELSALSRYRDDSDLRWAKETVREWINQTNVDNQSIPVAPAEDLNLLTAGIGLLLFILILLFFRRFSKKMKDSQMNASEQ